MVEFSIDDLLYYRNFSRESTATNSIFLTKYAKKYGERGPKYLGIRAGKSGLTPVNSVLGTIPESFDEYSEKEELDEYQRRHFFLFTSQDFTDVLAAEKPDAQPSSLWNTSSNSPASTFLGFLGAKIWSAPTEDDIDPDLDDNIGIMPLLQRRNWIYQIGYRTRIFGTKEGYWDAKTDEVWKALKPSLQ